MAGRLAADLTIGSDAVDELVQQSPSLTGGGLCAIGQFQINVVCRYYSAGERIPHNGKI